MTKSKIVFAKSQNLRPVHFLENNKFRNRFETKKKTDRYPK